MAPKNDGLKICLTSASTVDQTQMFISRKHWCFILLAQIERKPYFKLTLAESTSEVFWLKVCRLLHCCCCRRHISLPEQKLSLVCSRRCCRRHFNFSSFPSESLSKFYPNFWVEGFNVFEEKIGPVSRKHYSKMVINDIKHPLIQNHQFQPNLAQTGLGARCLFSSFVV